MDGDQPPLQPPANQTNQSGKAAQTTTPAVDSDNVAQSATRGSAPDTDTLAPELTVQTEEEITQPEPDFFVRKSQGSKFIIEYRRDLCIGAGSCAAIAPNTFVMDDENKAVFIRTAELDMDEVILAAAQSCPVLAIVIKDAETGEQIFPPV